MTAVICMMAPLSIPVGPVSMTMQNFVLGLTAVVLGGKRALISYLIYLLLGIAGLPVFSDYSAGIDKIFGPTGGFLIGFLFVILFGGLAADWAIRRWGCRHLKTIVCCSLALIGGNCVLYLIGVLWFGYIQQIPPKASAGVCVVPFIVPDLVKLSLAAFTGLSVRYALGRAGRCPSIR